MNNIIENNMKKSMDNVTLRAFDNVGMTMTLKNGGVYNIVAKHSNIYRLYNGEVRK